MGKIIRCNVSQPRVKEAAWQYDFGKSLLVEGLSEYEGSTISIHFAAHEYKGTVTEVPATVTEEGILAPIPDKYFRNDDTTHDYNIYAFVYVTTGKSARTVARIIIPIESRSKPADFPASSGS